MSSGSAPVSARTSAVIASGTIVSRVLGFVNVTVLATAVGQFGAGPTAFSLANQLPSYVYTVIAGGLLSAVFVPHIVRAAKNADGGQGFVNRLVTLCLVAFLAATVLATLAAPVITRVYALAGSDASLAGGGFELAVAMAYWCLPQIFFYAVYTLVGEVLAARGVFGPTAWAPVVNNVVMIAGLVLFGVLFGVAPAHDDPATWDTARILVLAGSATAGVVLQTIVLMLFWKRTGLTFRPDFRWRGTGLGAPARAAGWVFGMVMVVQVTNFVQSNVTVTIDADDASMPVLRTTWLLFVLSHSIITISIATPYFTRMSESARDADLGGVRRDLSTALRLIGALLTAAGVGVAAAALPFSAVFAPDNAADVAWVLLPLLVGLVPFSCVYLVNRAYYALGDTRTPFWLQVLQAVVFCAAVVASLAVPSEWRAAAISLATSLSYIVQAIIGALLLRARLGGGGGGIVRRFGVFALVAIPAAAAGIGMLALLGGFDAHGFATAGRVEGFLATGAIGATVVAVFLALLAVLRAPELRWTLSFLKRS